MEKKLPVFHRFAYHYAQQGFRGSSHVWNLVRIFSVEKDGNIIFLPNGFPMIIDKKDWIARTIYEGTYERPLLDFLNKISVTSGFVDVGANIGITLWTGMRNSGSKATYSAIEPSSQCQKGLELTTQHIDRSGRIFRIALGHKSEHMMMHGLNNPEQSGGASLLANEGLKGEEIKVQVRTLDELVSEGEIANPIFLLKIDTEGYEEKVLEGSHNIISQFEISIFILEVSPSFSSTDWVRSLHDRISKRYTFYRLIEEGKFKRKARLLKIEINDAVKVTQQWNLVILRNDYLLKEKEILNFFVKE